MTSRSTLQTPQKHRGFSRFSKFLPCTNPAASLIQGLANQQQIDEDLAAKDWQHFVSHAKSPERIESIKNKWVQDHPQGFLNFFFVSDDVKKSDSLKAPYVGTFVFDAVECHINALKQPSLRGLADLVRYELRFGYKKGRWEFLDGSAKLNEEVRNNNIVSGSIVSINSKYFAPLFAD